MRARQRHLNWRDRCGLYLDSRYINQSNGSAVSSWSDRSGNSRNVSNATGAQQPIYTTNAIGGNGAVEFDGTSDRLVGTSVNWYQYVTAFFVAKSDDTAAAKGQYVFWDGNTNNSGGSFHYGILYGYTTFFGKGWQKTNPPYAESDATTPGGIGSWVIGSAELSATSNIWENGAVPSAKTTANGSLTNNAYTFQIGFENFWYFDGQVALVAVFTSALDAPLRKRYEKAAAYSFKLACS